MTDVYKADLCGCMEDCGFCCKAWCCPCCVVGDNIAAAQGEPGMNVGCCLLTLCCPLCTICQSRTKVQERAGIAESPLTRCCLSWCCPLCALVQDHRELKARGLITVQPN